MKTSPLLHTAAIVSALVAATAGFGPAAAAGPPALPLDASEALEAIARAGVESHSDALLVIRDGEVLLERYSDAGPAPIELMSATKSVVALGIGRLLAQGHLESLDVPVSTWYPEWRQGRKADITVRMLLDHTSGLQNVANAGAEIYPAPDVVQLALAAELDATPGEEFAYNNKATNLLAGVIARASGQPMDEYLGEHLFAHLGIEAGDWYRDQAGNPHAMAGLPLTARDAARIGQLLLADGRLQDGTRLLPEGFVEELFAPSARSEQVGLLWWRIPEWQRVSLRDGAGDYLAAHGVAEAFIAALRPLAGQDFASARDALRKALGEGYAEQWMEQVAARGLEVSEVFDQTRGPAVGYRADGYLGQHIVVVPQQCLVAVRQIRSREAEGAHPPDSGYPGFPGDVISLARAFSADPATAATPQACRGWPGSGLSTQAP